MDAELSVEFECKREYEWPDASTKIDKASQIPLAVCALARAFTFRDSKKPCLDPYFFVIL